MPLRVPTEGMVQEQTLQLPGAQPLGDNGLGAIAEGTSVAANQFREQQIELDRKRNAAMTFDAETQLADAYRVFETGARQRRGIDAAGVALDVQNWWDEKAPTFEAGLENETQRTLFNESVQRRRAASLDAFSVFEAQQRDAAVTESGQAKIVAAVNSGAANYDNQASIDLAREEIIDSVGVLVGLRGGDQAAYDAALQESLTDLHTQVIQNLVEVSPAHAREYFEANKDEIAGSQHDSLRKTMQDGEDIVTAQRLADDIWNRGLGRAEALAAAGSEAEGQTREQALALLRQRYAEREQDEQRAAESIVDNGWATFNAGGVGALTPGQIADLNRVAPTTLKAMRDTAWTPRDEINTDWVAYYDLVDLYNSDRAMFAKVDLRIYTSMMNPREMNVLAGLQGDIADAVSSQAATTQQILGEVAWDDDDATREGRGRFEQRVRERIEQEARASGGQLPPARIREIMDDELVSVRVPNAGWFWLDREKPRYQLTTEDEIAVQYDAIPEDVRSEAEADLRAAGYEPSKQNVILLYQRFVEQGNQ